MVSAGEHTAPIGELFQRLTTLPVKYLHPISSLNGTSFNFQPLPHVIPLSVRLKLPGLNICSSRRSRSPVGGSQGATSLLISGRFGSELYAHSSPIPRTQRARNMIVQGRSLCVSYKEELGYANGGDTFLFKSVSTSAQAAPGETIRSPLSLCSSHLIPQRSFLSNPKENETLAPFKF